MRPVDFFEAVEVGFFVADFAVFFAVVVAGGFPVLLVADFVFVVEAFLLALFFAGTGALALRAEVFAGALLALDFAVAFFAVCVSFAAEVDLLVVFFAAAFVLALPVCFVAMVLSRLCDWRRALAYAVRLRRRETAMTATTTVARTMPP